MIDTLGLSNPVTLGIASALTDDVGRLCLVLFVVAGLGLVVIGLALRRLSPEHRGGEDGTATIEFTLALPIVLFFGLLVTQTALLMVGNFQVHGAAFAATRSAIVQIPRDLSSEGGGLTNEIIPSLGFPKFDAIYRSAVFSLVSVSGELEESTLNTEPFVDGLERMYTASGASTPGWVDGLAANRLRYAAENTEVVILEVTNSSSREISFPFTFGPRDAVGVRVEHRLNLAVPYVRAIFADDNHETATGSGAYAELSASAVMTNTGNARDLPEQPPIPRRP